MTHFTTHWVCVASRFAVPPVPCSARGENDRGAEKHIRDTGHPTLTTTRLEVANKLAGPTSEGDDAA